MTPHFTQLLLGKRPSYDIQFNSLNLDASNEQIVYASDASTAAGGLIWAFMCY